MKEKKHMRTLFLEADLMLVILMVVLGCIIFLLQVLLLRWIFKIEKIVSCLEKQNDYSLVQVRLLKKMLIDQGASPDEVDTIISGGNKK